MSHAKLADIVLDFIEFLELAGDEQLDPDTAVGMQESIAAHLNEGTSAERVAVQQAAKDRLASLLRGPDEYGYSPRKMVTPERRALLESIVSGKAYGWPPHDAT